MPKKIPQKKNFTGAKDDFLLVKKPANKIEWGNRNRKEWDELVKNNEMLMIQLNLHMKKAETHGNSKYRYNWLQLDLATLAGEYGITTNYLKETLHSLNNNEVNEWLDFLKEQHRFAFLSNPANSLMNKSLMKEYGEHSIELFDKKEARMPDIKVIKGNVAFHANMVEKLLQITEYRYDKPKRIEVVKSIKDL